MAANTYLQVSELDFNDIRNNLKNYLSTQDALQDYNFEGSAIATLLDVLAYNTHYNAYYLNMVGNEMFLDTAQQRDSVVSRAKELGYTPVSSRGATAQIKLTFSGVANTVAQFTIPKNSTFTTTIDDLTYTYVTTDSNIVLNSSNTFIKTISIKEGTPLTHRFTVDSSGTQRFILPNKNIDTSSIVVNVQESASDTSKTEYNLATNVKQFYNTSAIYFLQESSDEKYEISFGDGALGRAVKSGNIVIVDYLVNNGPTTNGANTFSIDSMTLTGASYSSAAVTLVTKASGGHSAESVESIKFNAPRNFQTQNRAVVDNDYQRILLAENADLQSVISFGGEQADPAVYGKVYIAVKPYGEDFTTNIRKEQIKTSINDRTPLGIDPVIIDPDYIYIVPTINTYYDATSTTSSETQIISNIRTTVASFSDNNLERFGNKLRFSRFTRALDNITTGSILNNDVSLILQKRIIPSVTAAERQFLKFNNKIRPGTLTSTEFTYSGFAAFLDDDSNGNINIYRYNADKTKTNIVDNAGTVNYTTGEIEINAFKPTNYVGTYLRISATPDRFDITPVREQILILDHTSAIITATGEN